ncbi:MAG TPA: heliorhodopsin HeR [Candidatus Limnocylindrales bacterium]|nr:heliorhodopsin HeR [Candidatus Limnocylindrales bacterium]
MTALPADAGTLPAPAAAAAVIPEATSRSLRRWNRFLTFAHFGQFLLMIAVSSTAALFEPVVPTVRPVIEDGAFAGIEQTSVLLFSIPLAYVIASFFLMSAIAHASAGWLLRGRYEAWLARGMNPLRWVEYAFSSTVMIVAIAYVSFITDFPALVAIAGCNVAMNLFGWSMEAANEGREKPDWKHFIFGCIAGIVPWLAIFSILWAYGAQEGLPAEAGIPGFVYVIIASLFVAFNIFAITMVLQYRKVGRWRNYLYGEKTYMVLSLVAKSLLAWQVWSGTLRPPA